MGFAERLDYDNCDSSFEISDLVGRAILHVEMAGKQV